ncbi:MAG: zinc-ribbon domain-containing protein [Nitrospinota bacterium]
MQVTCNACKKSMNIPDEKLPKDQAFSITCPGCKTKIKVDQHLKPKQSEPAPPPAQEKEETVDTASMIVSQEEYDDDEDLVIYDDNDQLALVLDDKNKDVWTKALEEKDFKIQYAKSPEHAVHKMKFTHFHFVALNENFGNVPLDQNVLYQTVIEMPMVTRRNIFFALVGANFKSLNNMQAFQKSVNVVINEKDLEKLGDILKKSISENEIFYKVYKETLHAMGKA